MNVNVNVNILPHIISSWPNVVYDKHHGTISHFPYDAYIRRKPPPRPATPLPPTHNFFLRGGQEISAFLLHLATYIGKIGP